MSSKQAYVLVRPDLKNSALESKAAQQQPETKKGGSPALVDAPSKELGMVLGRRPARRFGGKGRTKAGGSKSSVPKLPPDLAAGGRQVLSTRLRFDATATVASSVIDDWCLLGAIGTVGTATNSSVATIASAVRLKRVTVWPAAGGEASIIWAAAVGALFGNPDVIHDETVPGGVTSTAPVSSRPPRASPASMWHVPSTSTPIHIFDLSCTQGSVIDVELDFTLAAGFNPRTLTVATASIGLFYYLYLDGSPVHQIKPLGRPTTF